MLAPLSLSSSSTGQSCSTTWGWLGGVMLFSFCFLSISQMESAERFICNGDERAFVSLFHSLHISLSSSRRMTTASFSLSLVRRAAFNASRFCLSMCYFLLFLFSRSFSLFLSSLARERRRYINRGRWGRAHYWFFPSFYMSVCARSSFCERAWIESRLRRSLFFFLSSFFG